MGATSGMLFMMTGQIYVYNNTLLNQDEKGYGGIGTTEKKVFEEGQTKFSDRVMKNITTRNNILHVPAGVNSISKYTDRNDSLNPADTNESYEYDMVMPDISKLYEFTPKFYTNNRVEGIPDYDGHAKLHSNRSGNFKLEANTLGTGRGKCIPNIIRKNSKGKVDIGAQDSSVSHMYFGVDYNFTPPSIFEQCLN